MGDIADYLLDQAMENWYMYQEDEEYEEPKPDENIRYTCSICGSKGIIRTNSKTGEKFVGCSSFPRCKNTSSFREEELTDKENDMTEQEVYSYFLEEYKKAGLRIPQSHLPDFKTKKEVDEWVSSINEIIKQYANDKEE